MPEGSGGAKGAEVEEKFRLAREVIGALDRALRTRRLYQPDHPIYVENTQEILLRMIEFFERHAYLRLDITPTELAIEGRMVINAAARPTELPFRLYKDGIREIRFQRGLTREELLDFIGIMELTVEELSDLAEDYVSLLWSKDFKSIDYLAVDEFELAEGESPVGLEPETAKIAQEVVRRVNEGVRRLTAREFDTGAGERKEAYRLGIDEAMLAFPVTTIGDAEEDVGVLGSIEPIRRDPGPAPEPAEGPPLPEVVVDSIFMTPGDEAQAAMRSEVEHETIGGALRRSVDILMRLQGTDGKTLHNELGPLLRGVVDFYVAKGDFGSIGYLLSHLQETKLLEARPEDRALWDALVESVRRPELRKTFVGYLNRTEVADTGLARYFKVVGPAMLRTSCQVYAMVQNPPGRAALRNYLLEFGMGDPPAFRDLMAMAGDKYLVEVFDIVREVRPPGVAIDLETLLRHEAPQIRRQAITLAGRGEGPLRTKHLLAALGDADSGVRIHALRVIGETKEAALRTPLQDWIERGEFVNRDWGEKDAAMQALGQVGGPAAYAFLRAIAQKAPGVFQRAKAIETRRAAVLGIREIGTTEANDYLSAAAKSGDEQLRTFAQETLAEKTKDQR